MNAELFVNQLLCLAREHPGQAVALIEQPAGLQVGVLNIVVEDDDWFSCPVPLEQLTLDVGLEAAKINSVAEKVTMAP